MPWKPVTSVEWKSFFEAFSRDLRERVDSPLEQALRDSGQTLEQFLGRSRVTMDAWQSGWLGYPPATDHELARLERFIGKPLPPSYRALLRASNGFCMPLMHLFRLRPAEDVQWFRIEGQLIIDSVKPFEDLSNMLQVADPGVDGEMLLLDPDHATPDGEWPAVTYGASDAPSCTRYASLWEVLQFNYAHSVLSERGEGALSRTGDSGEIFEKIPTLIGHFDRKIRSLREDPYLPDSPRREDVARIVETARACLIDVTREPVAAPVMLQRLVTLAAEFRAEAVTSARAGQSGWFLSMGIMLWFLNGREHA